MPRLNLTETRYRRCTCKAVVKFNATYGKDAGRCPYCQQSEEKMEVTTVKDYERWKKRNCQA